MKLSLPSVSQILTKSAETFLRFPMVIMAGFSMSIAAIWLIEIEPSEPYQIFNLAFVSGLGISVFYAGDTYGYSLHWSQIKLWVVRTILFLVLCSYGWLLKESLLDGPAEHWFRFVLFVLASHLLVSFAPFIHSSSMDQFWEYNKSLFLRILISGLYSGVLYIGLVIALFAIRYLLEIDIKDIRFGQLFFLLAGVFNTWFFLSGVPDVSKDESLKLEFPKGLKLFVQYVLIPLVSVYIIILYSYLVKIVIQWELPNGWVSNLVLTFSIAGIFSLLLLYPVRDKADQLWIKIYSKAYYLLLVPLVLLLMVSIGTRISEYGVTVNRYFVATLGVWLTGIVLYHIFSERKNIKVIPMSLFVLTVLISFGPLGVFEISERSQIGRFESLLTTNDLLDEDGFFQKADTVISFDERKEISSIADYLLKIHGLESIRSFIKEEVVTNREISKGEEGLVINGSWEIVKMLGFEFVNEWQTEPEPNEDKGFGFSLRNQEYVVDITPYDFDLGEFSFYSGKDSAFVNDGEYFWRIYFDYEQDRLSVKEQRSGKSIDFGVNHLVSAIQENHKNIDRTPYTVNPEEMIISTQNEDFDVMTVFSFIGGSSGEEIRLSNINFQIYIKVK